MDISEKEVKDLKFERGLDSIDNNQLLGSVTTYTNNVENPDGSGSSKNCQQIRSSARVFKKMKQDSALANSSPSTSTSDKDKKDSKETVKADSKKPSRPTWTTEDKNLFFEALNEYGKDFEAIHNFISNKLKKKGLPDSIRTREQVRLLYHRTFHKISKHLKFSDDIKKNVQELYALINFGELRKKLGAVSEKTCFKLNEMIYRGSAQIRVKGKNIRVRTPMCKALRRLNEIDDKHFDLKLPTRVTLELTPKDMKSWNYVQSMAQNPRVKVMLPLQRRLSAVMQYFSQKWKSSNAQEYENAINQASELHLDDIADEVSIREYKTMLEPPLHFAPLPNATVDLPNIALSEYLTSSSICLNAYEERLGISPTSEQLWLTDGNVKGAKYNTKKNGAKRRSECSCDKTSKKENNITEDVMFDYLDSDAHLLEAADNAVNTIFALDKIDNEVDSKSLDISENIKMEKDAEFSIKKEERLKRDEEIAKVKSGWKVDDCGILSIGDLYLMIGKDSKIQLEYWFEEPIKPKIEASESELCSNNISAKNTTDSNEISLELQKLLSFAKLHYRKARINCPCGHVCSKNNFAKSKTEKVNLVKVDSLPTIPVNVESPETLFRRPILPYPCKSTAGDVFRAQLEKMRPRYCNRRGRPVRSKQVVVQRMLPLLPKPLDGTPVVTMKVVPSLTGELVSISPPSNNNNAEKNDTTLNPSEGVSTEKPLVEAAKESNSITEATALDEEVEVLTVNSLSSSSELEKPITLSRVNSPNSISTFIDMAIRQNAEIDTAKMDDSSLGVWVDNLTGSTPLPSPSRLLKDDDQQWLNSEVGDFSLSSLLGHLESPLKTPTVSVEERLSQDVDDQFHSLFIENSLEYSAKFADLAAQVAAEGAKSSD